MRKMERGGVAGVAGHADVKPSPLEGASSLSSSPPPSSSCFPPSSSRPASMPYERERVAALCSLVDLLLFAAPAPSRPLFPSVPSSQRSDAEAGRGKAADAAAVDGGRTRGEVHLFCGQTAASLSPSPSPPLPPGCLSCAVSLVLGMALGPSADVSMRVRCAVARHAGRAVRRWTEAYGRALVGAEGQRHGADVAAGQGTRDGSASKGEGRVSEAVGSVSESVLSDLASAVGMGYPHSDRPPPLASSPLPISIRLALFSLLSALACLPSSLLHPPSHLPAPRHSVKRKTPTLSFSLSGKRDKHTSTAAAAAATTAAAAAAGTGGSAAEHRRASSGGASSGGGGGGGVSGSASLTVRLTRPSSMQQQQQHSGAEQGAVVTRTSSSGGASGGGGGGVGGGEAGSAGRTVTVTSASTPPPQPQAEGGRAGAEAGEPVLRVAPISIRRIRVVSTLSSGGDSQGGGAGGGSPQIS